MLGLDHHRDAARLQDLLDRGRDLRSHVLLRLQPPRIDIDQPRQLGKADHPVDRLVGDVRLASEGHHVVLAMRVEGDVAHKHEVVVPADLAESAFQHIHRAFAIAAVKFLVGVDHALGRVAQPLAVGIISGVGNQRAHRRERLLARWLGHHGSGGRTHVIGQG